jgi:hypothetical protein
MPKQKEIFSLFDYPTLYNFILNLNKHAFISWEVYLAPEYQDWTQKVVGVKFLDPRSMQKYIDKNTWNIVNKRRPIVYFILNKGIHDSYQELGNP